MISSDLTEALTDTLSDEELRQFLNDLEDEDADILQDGQNAEARLEELSDIDEGALQEEDPENLLLEETMQDKAWRVDTRPTIKNGAYVGEYLMGEPKFTLESEPSARLDPDRMRAVQQKSTEARHKKTQERRLRKINIQRLALQQDIIVMSDIIPAEQLRDLITTLTKEHTRMIDKYKRYIDRRFTQLLRPLIPRLLLRVYKEYPYSVHRCPGFLYTASKEFGKGLPYWVRPDIPYYFAQGTELALIKQYMPDYLFNIDYAIERLHYHQTERRAKELSYAEKLINRRNFTYFSLLKLNPFWWEILYNLIYETHE